MDNFNINNKEYLLSLKPRHNFIPIITFIVILIIIVSLFFFKTYDVYNTKAYLECDTNCNIMISVDPKEINKVSKIDFIKLNNKVINHSEIIIENIQVDEINKINYQNVIYEVDQLDNDILNTFQDVKIYSKYENIFEKIKKIIV